MSPNHYSPDNVLVVTFGEDAENDENAYQALTDLKQLDSQGQIKVVGGAVVDARRRRSRRDQERGRGPPVRRHRERRPDRPAARDHRRPARRPDRRLDRPARRIAVRHRRRRDDRVGAQRDLEAGSPDPYGGPRAGHRAERRCDRQRDGAAWAARSCAGRSSRSSRRSPRPRRPSAKAEVRGPARSCEKARREQRQGGGAREGRGAEVEAPPAQGGRFRIAAGGGGGALSPSAPPPSFPVLLRRRQTEQQEDACRLRGLLGERRRQS